MDTSLIQVYIFSSFDFYLKIDNRIKGNKQRKENQSLFT